MSPENEFDNALAATGFIRNNSVTIGTGATCSTSGSVACNLSIYFTTDGSYRLESIGCPDQSNTVIDLQNQLSGMTSEYNKLVDEKIKLLVKISNQEHNYNELQKAHDGLREIVDVLPDLDETREVLDNYKNTVRDLLIIIDDKKASINRLERELKDHPLDSAFCIDDDYYLDREVALKKLYETAQKEVHNASSEFSEKFVETGYVGEFTEWDGLTLGQKVEKLNAGMTVWSASTGAGPLRTIVESKAEIGKKDSTFGVWCQNSRGKTKKYYVADLTPFKPNVNTPSKLNLCVSTMLAGGMSAYAAYVAFGIKGAVVAGVAQTALMLFQMREYSKA